LLAELDKEKAHLEKENTAAEKAEKLAKAQKTASNDEWNTEKGILSNDKKGLTEALEVISDFQVTRSKSESMLPVPGAFLQSGSHKQPLDIVAEESNIVAEESKSATNYQGAKTDSNAAFTQLIQAAKDLKTTKKEQIKDINKGEDDCQADLAREITNALNAAQSMDQNGDQIHQLYDQFNQKLADIRNNQDSIRDMTKEINEVREEKANTQAEYKKEQAFEQVEHNTMQEVLTQLTQLPKGFDYLTEKTDRFEDDKASGNQQKRNNLGVVITLVKSLMSESQQKTARSINSMNKKNTYYSELLSQLQIDLGQAEAVVKDNKADNTILLGTAQGLATTDDKSNSKLRSSLFGTTKDGSTFQGGIEQMYKKLSQQCQRYKNAASITKILNHEIDGLDNAVSALQEIINNPDANGFAGDEKVPGQKEYDADGNLLNL